QGRDPVRHRGDRRRRRDERRARIRRPSRGDALGRRAARRREHGGPGPCGGVEALAVANMRVEAGWEPGIFPADAKVEAYLEGRARSSWTAERSDADATFRQRLSIDLSALEPLVALPHLPGNVQTVAETAGVPVDQVYIGNCANGTMT